MSGKQDAYKALMLKVAQAFAHGDMEPLLAAIDDDIEWVSNSPTPYFRFGGARTGRDRMSEWVGLVMVTYQFKRFDPVEIVAEGDTVWGLFNLEATHIPTQKAVQTFFAARWTMKNGKVASHQGLFDTAGLLIQQGYLPARPEGFCTTDARQKA